MKSLFPTLIRKYLGGSASGLTQEWDTPEGVPPFSSRMKRTRSHGYLIRKDMGENTSQGAFRCARLAWTPHFLRRGFPAAFSLVEVTLALGLAVFVLVSLFALIPVGINSSRNSIEESRAMNILSAVISDRQATPPDQASIVYNLPVLTNSQTAVLTGYFGVDENHLSTGTSLKEARFRVDYRIAPPSPGKKGPFFGQFRASWPATAPKAESAVEIVASFPQS